MPKDKKLAYGDLLNVLRGFVVEHRELIDAAETVLARVDHTNIHTSIGDMRDTWDLLRPLVARWREHEPMTQ